MKKLGNLTSQMRQRNFAPTTEQTQKSSLDGIKHGETGSSKPSSSVTQTSDSNLAMTKEATEGLTLLKPFLLERTDEDQKWIMPFAEDFNPDDLDVMRINCEVALEGAPDETIAQAIDQVWETLSCEPLSVHAYQGYIEALSDIPRDLIWDAVKGILRNYVYPTPPKPAHFREQVSEEMSNRRLILFRINIMAKHKEYIKSLKERDNAIHK